mmetsp:Transcript_16757/g.1497  ORF Transcript_16757/g.1497 Transcript_16757/m.1497 type:complete len:85 (+) Transcript_16757:80-334(+)
MLLSANSLLRLPYIYILLLLSRLRNISNYSYLVIWLCNLLNYSFILSHTLNTWYCCIRRHVYRKNTSTFYTISFRRVRNFSLVI